MNRNELKNESFESFKLIFRPNQPMLPRKVAMNQHWSRQFEEFVDDRHCASFQAPSAPF